LAIVPGDFGVEDNEIREGGAVIRNGLGDRIVPGPLPDIDFMRECRGGSSRNAASDYVEKKEPKRSEMPHGRLAFGLVHDL
jgi:hypothetical protein